MEGFDGFCAAWRTGCSIDWRNLAIAIGLLSGPGAVAAAVAAWAAARNTLKADENAARRLADRERRDAVPLAVAIQYEVYFAGGMSAYLDELMKTVGVDDIHVLQYLQANRAIFELRTIADNLDRLGCFDEATSRRLGKTLTVSRMLARAIPYQEIHAEMAPKVMEQVVHFGKVLRIWADRCEVALTAYSGIEPRQIATELSFDVTADQIMAAEEGRDNNQV